MTDTRYTITELAREFEITPRAIRFYENQGLLTPAREGTNGMRRVYSARDRTRLKLTLRGKRLGFTLLEVSRLLDLYDSPTGTIAQLHAFLDTIAEHRAVLERQLGPSLGPASSSPSRVRPVNGVIRAGRRRRERPPAGWRRPSV